MQIIKFAYSWILMKILEIREKSWKLRDVHANLSTFQLLTILYYKPWYQFNANIYHVYLMDQYANYLKIVFMNII